MRIKVVILSVVIIILIALGYSVFRFADERQFSTPPISRVAEDNPLASKGPKNGEQAREIEIIAENLNIPWDIAFLPEGGYLVSERGGTLVHIAVEGDKKIIEVENVNPPAGGEGEGGLLGIVLHPDFKNNRNLYIYTTTEIKGGTVNRVLRYALRQAQDKNFDGAEGKQGLELTNEKIIIDNIPGAIYHDGGRMEFGPDGKLYITTGDSTKPELSQLIISLGGKVLRLNDDGSIPDDNPFGNAVWSYGHRNPQGLTWDNTGNLWSTEHGRSGVTSGLDEINLIIKGGNYGWPQSQGDVVEEGTVAPKLHSGTSITWAPASAEYFDGSIFFGGLQGEALYEGIIKEGEIIKLEKHFDGEYGRIRTVRIGPDGMIYFMTSNRDGRGTVREGDDRVVRISPTILRRD